MRRKKTRWIKEDVRENIRLIPWVVDPLLNRSIGEARVQAGVLSSAESNDIILGKQGMC